MYWLEIQIDRVIARTSSAVLATMYWSAGVTGSLDQVIDELTEKYGLPDWIRHEGREYNELLAIKARVEHIRHHAEQIIKLLDEAAINESAENSAQDISDLIADAARRVA